MSALCLLRMQIKFLIWDKPVERQQDEFVVVGENKTQCILKKHIKGVNLDKKNAFIIVD